MKDGPHIARIAALIGDSARAEVLTALMADRALTATELADIAGVTKQTISAHLAKLLDAGLIAVESQGRHRYFRLADRDVAHLLESVMNVAFRAGAVRLRASPREPALRRARMCYDHLAGEVGVQFYEALVRQGMLQATPQGPPSHPLARSGLRTWVSTRPRWRCNGAWCAAPAWTGASAATTWAAPWARRCCSASSMGDGPAARRARAWCTSPPRASWRCASGWPPIRPPRTPAPHKAPDHAETIAAFYRHGPR